MINVLVADDHGLVREGLKRILESEGDIKCVGMAKDGIEAVEMAKELDPDIAIIDVKMPNMDGIEATKIIKEQCPSIAIIVLSAYDYSEYVFACLQNGADGYILKDSLPSEGLLNIVRIVNIGSDVIDRRISHMLFETYRRRKVPRDLCELAPREIEILELASSGMSNKQIAIKLSISNQTVGTHFANIFKKLDVQSRMEAVLLGIQKGWIHISREQF